MTRTYTLKRRAEQQAETRQRIVEAAVDLHSSVGPAATTMSMLAERAGVQRHTVYAHFPDERSLFLACSGRALERNPLPNAEPWRAIGDTAARLRVGFAELYGWYARNAEFARCVLRDAETHPLTREINGLRIEPAMAGYRELLGVGLTTTQRAVLHLALGFPAWRALVRESGLTQEEAVDAMVQAVMCCAGAD